MQSVFIAISSLLAIISPIIYIRAIVWGKVRPHRTTRFVILVITVLATASLFAQHNTVAIWLAGISALQAIAIFTVSIKRGMGGWAKMDIVCLVIALVGIFLWQTTKDATLALYSAIAADLVGMVPAMIKTYRFPQTEIWSFFALDVFAALFSLLALKSWAPQEFSYPLYIFFINLVMVLLIVRPLKMWYSNRKKGGVYDR